MRAAFTGLILALTGCTEMPTSSGGPAAGDAPTGAQQAYFKAYPSRLFAAAALTCDGPGQSVLQPSQNEVRCESLPDPESAAALILEFDGTVQALPTFVIAISGRDTTQGYLVTADNYIRVPQREGGAQQIRFDDPVVAQDINTLLQAAGGRPL